jgi:pimeloyl-ACP methyl ester carboxylesterase
MPTITHRVAVPGGHLNMVTDGDGPPILLVHAGIADLRSWDQLVPFLTAAGHRVIRYDMRGFGASTTDDVAFSNRSDLLAVLDAAGVSRAVFVGNSRGAMVCLDTILETPERAVAFAWVGGGIGGFEGEVTPEELAIMARPIPLDPPADDRLGELTLPILAVVGALDASPTRAAAIRLETAAPNARRIVIPQVAHMVGMEAPARLAELILELVRPLGSWA